MMTTVYQRNKERAGWRRKTLFAFCGVAVFIFLVTTGLGNWASFATVLVSQPFWLAGNFVGREVNSLRALLASKKKLVAEREVWGREVARARLALFEQKRLRAENEELRAILGRQATETKPLYGRVISKPNQSPYDLLFVDLGATNTNRALVAGDRVMAGEDLLIGEVAAIYGHTAKIRLFSSPGVERAVLVGDNEIVSLARGQGGGTFLINLPRGLEVKEGDPVRTSFEGKIFLLGFVAELKSEPSDAFQEIRFKNPANIYELKSVEIYHD